MKFLPIAFVSLFCMSAFATDTPSINVTVNPVTPPPAARVALFSTTVDWEAVTGLHLNQYIGKIKGVDKALVKQGLVLYYLDAFPCYGEAGNVRVWLSPNGKPNQNLRLVSILLILKISFIMQ